MEQFLAGRKDGFGQLLPLAQRIGKGAASLMVGDAIDPEVALNLSRDSNAFRDQLNAAKGAVGDADGKQKLALVEKMFTEDMGAVNAASMMITLKKMATPR